MFTIAEVAAALTLKREHLQRIVDEAEYECVRNIQYEHLTNVPHQDSVVRLVVCRDGSEEETYALTTTGDGGDDLVVGGNEEKVWLLPANKAMGRELLHCRVGDVTERGQVVYIEDANTSK